MTFEQFLSTLKQLRVDRSGGVPKPYKPVLLAAVVILIHKGEIRSREVFLDGGLKSVFLQLLAKLFPGQFASAKPEYPFRHLETDRVWRLVPRAGAEAALESRIHGGEAWQVLKHVRCAQLDQVVFDALASSFENRFTVLQLLIQTYRLPVERSGLLWDLLGVGENAGAARTNAEPLLFTERALEQHLEDHWASTEFFRQGIRLCRPEVDDLPGRQVLTPRNTIDLLGYQKAERAWWVFELKKGRTSDAVVGQVGRYMTWVGDQAKARDRVHGAIIVGRVDENLKASVRSNPRLSLWRYDDRLEVHPVTLTG